MDGNKMSQPKICRVCGDKALGFNFNVITCESCKAFFRRNAAKNKQNKCPFQNKCDINVDTRRFCKKCRLAKCFNVGMNNEWIVSEEEKLLKDAKINGNKMNRNLHIGWKLPKPTPYPMEPTFEMVQSTSTNPIRFVQNVNPKPQARVNAMPQQPVSIAATEPPQGPPHLKFPQTFENTQVFAHNEGVHPDLSWHNSSFSPALLNFNYCNVNKSHQPLNNFSKNYSSYMQPINCVPVYNDVEMKSCDEKRGNSVCSGAKNITNKISSHSPVKEVLDIAIAAEYSDLANGTGLQRFGSNVLTAIETQKISELIRASPFSQSVLQTTSNERNYFKERSDQYLKDIMNLTDRAITMLINFSKKITAFKHLCEEDQITLLKGSCTELMILRSAITYDSEKDGWKIPDFTYFRMDQLQKTKDNIYEEYKRFVQSFDSSWKEDETIILILTIIILLTSTRPNISHPEVIEKEQCSYYFLLQRYLESKHSACDAQVWFIKLIQTVQELKKLNENHVRVFLDANPKYVGPLLIEIFDLKC